MIILWEVVFILMMTMSRGIKNVFADVLEINYSFLAGEAESNKRDILNFLDQKSVTEQYRKLYDSLLMKLNGSQPPRRHGSGRRIVLGHNTSITAVPWQVSLREKTYPICGGSVVTDTWIVTAAHCLLRAHASDLSVRLGSSWKTHGGEMYDVKSSSVHPRYVSMTKNNDVGLVELHTPLRFSARVLPIKLVEKRTRVKGDVMAIVSGWGKLKEDGPSVAYLQSTSIKTIPMKLCRQSGLDHKAIDPASMFCAGSFTQPSPDACQGDSGGPLVEGGVLIGVVSWGLGCARGNFPGVYTRLANPVIWDWVRNHISGAGNNTCCKKQC